MYVPRAEGFDLTELKAVTPCSTHRFNFRHTADMLLRHACKTTQCCCVSRNPKDKSKEDSDSLSAVQVKRKKEGGAGESKRVHAKKVLWTYEINSLVTAYRWLLENRSREYAKCCDAVIVYQLKRSLCLPPGLYVYRTRPRHFGCILERPIAVVEQFNFVGRLEQAELPKAITIDMFPGRDNFSSMYILTRKLMFEDGNKKVIPEYGNRMFGEATALGIVESYGHGSVAACEHHEVAIRTERVCVLDLRWKGLDTKTLCVEAVPKLRGLKAVLWSNHSSDVQEIECKVLTWLFGLANELPREVEMIDYSHEALGVRYILVDMDTFPEVLPKPTCEGVSFYIHTYFTGDLKLARNAIGDVSGTRSRMGSPRPYNSFDFWYTLQAIGHCHPTPFTCGLRHARATIITDEFKKILIDWTLSMDGSKCEGLAVQHTLYYHWERSQYKMMITHTLVDKDSTLSMFKL